MKLQSSALKSLKRSEYIENFEIENKEPLYEIAKICAQKNAGKTAENIREFAIESKIYLYEIAKICAQQDGHKTSPIYLKISNRGSDTPIRDR